MVLLIDNYDSFVYNLYQLIAGLYSDIKVYRNDKINSAQIKELGPKAIFFSPGPGRAEDAGNMRAIIHNFKGQIPMFGVCLGHQAICQEYGGEIGYAQKLMHGKSSLITYKSESILFDGLENPFKAARYHSLALNEESLKSNELIITSRSENNEVMSVEDKANKIFGVQFHPESVLTTNGCKIVENFFKYIGLK